MVLGSVATSLLYSAQPFSGTKKLHHYSYQNVKFNKLIKLESGWYWKIVKYLVNCISFFIYISSAISYVLDLKQKIYSNIFLEIDKYKSDQKLNFFILQGTILILSILTYCYTINYELKIP